MVAVDGHNRIETAGYDDRADQPLQLLLSSARQITTAQKIELITMSVLDASEPENFIQIAQAQGLLPHLPAGQNAYSIIGRFHKLKRLSTSLSFAVLGRIALHRGPLRAVFSPACATPFLYSPSYVAEDGAYQKKSPRIFKPDVVEQSNGKQRSDEAQQESEPAHQYFEENLEHHIHPSMKFVIRN